MQCLQLTAKMVIKPESATLLALTNNRMHYVSCLSILAVWSPSLVLKLANEIGVNVPRAELTDVPIFS